VAVSAPLTGLTCSTTYHFRALATNATGTQRGADMVFRTDECPGVSNLLLQHSATGCMVAWHMSGVSLLSQDFLKPSCVSDPNWHISGVADFDADGRKDVLFQNVQTGGILVWLMNSIVLRSQLWLTPGAVSDPNWRIVAVADFDADSRPDLIMQHRTDGRMLAWLLNGTVLKRQQFLSPGAVADPSWRIVGAGDVDSDGKPDLFFQHATSGYMVSWLMNGLTLKRQDWVTPNRVDPAWTIVAVTDVDWDTRPDLVLQHVNDGRMVAWPLNGAILKGQRWLNPSQVSDPRWRIVGPR
jgi:hypothetical protein